MPEPIPAIVASDANFFPGLQITVASAIVHEPVHPLAIHLLDGGLADWQWEALVATATRLNPATRLTRHALDASRYSGFSTGRGVTAVTYARLLAPPLVPEPAALYLDADLLITQPLSRLLPYFGTEKAVGAVPEGNHRLSRDCLWGEGMDLSSYRYVNAGLLALNLEKWRSERISERMLAFLDKESARCHFHDQTALNWLLRDDMEYLPQAWNIAACDYEEGMVKGLPGEVTLHYLTSGKPWTRRLPALSHQLWWLFHDIFEITPRPANPLVRPRNLARYVKQWLLCQRNGSHAAPGPGGLLADWQAFWENLRRADRR